MFPSLSRVSLCVLFVCWCVQSVGLSSSRFLMRPQCFLVCPECHGVSALIYGVFRVSWCFRLVSWFVYSVTECGLVYWCLCLSFWCVRLIFWCFQIVLVCPPCFPEFSECCDVSAFISGLSSVFCGVSRASRCVRLVFYLFLCMSRMSRSAYLVFWCVQNVAVCPPSFLVCP